MRQFQSTRPAWGRDRYCAARFARQPHFNPHAPHGGATHDCPHSSPSAAISIHTPRMGARQQMLSEAFAHYPFQSTRPAWGRDADNKELVTDSAIFQSTRPAWGRDDRSVEPILDRSISIHTPRMGARRTVLSSSSCRTSFQSTRPAWGRDPSEALARRAVRYFNPHAPHGGATLIDALALFVLVISIHTPRMGARPRSMAFAWHVVRFQSTRPAWGRDWT